MNSVAELSLPFVWSDDCTKHVPKGEIWVGVPIQGTEIPERATTIRQSLVAAGATEQSAVQHDDEQLLAVHDPELVEWLRNGYAEWLTTNLLQEPGQDRIVPYLFPTPAFAGPIEIKSPVAIHGRAGRFAYDTMTLVGPGTWEAARSAVDAALTAVDSLTDDTSVVYALCRPPGHHVTRGGYGGSCYLNNAAVAANALRNRGHEKVAVVDIDAHHGNGTQAIFYDREDVFYASVHVDPAAGWFPHYVGYASEHGLGAGEGTTKNVPLAEGTADAPWVEAVQSLVTATREYGTQAVVVSLGVDAAADDPESPLQVTADGYYEAGKAIADLGVPVVAVQEGGYHLPTLGDLVVSTLVGLQSGSRTAN